MTMELNYEITQLLAEEAATLDDRLFREWLKFYTDDALYWVTGWSDDPNAGIAVIYDERDRMEERVFRLLDTSAYAQMPPSRTVHTLGTVTNVVKEDDGISADGTIVVAEMRPGDLSQVGLSYQRSFHGRFSVKLVRDSEGKLLIKEKKIRLVDREQPIFNLTFIL